MKIPRHSIDKVRDMVDIVDVISGYVRLKKRGTNYFGLCPFHQEKTPSFSVHPGKQIYHCFGCGKGGNVFNFLMEYEKISYIDAVRKLAEQYHIRLEYEKTDEKHEYEIGLLYDIHNLAAKFFENSLYSSDGKQALEYMLSRGFKEQTLRTFRIGYSPVRANALFNFLKSKGYKEGTLVKSGLVLRGKAGDYFDRFRNRVMFPIVNVGSRIIAFAGRALEPDEKAKYLNSPETDIYSKSHILFGLEQAKNSIRELEKVILVEGYTDLMQLYQHGITNVVAGSGTAFTAGHARLLGRFVHTAYLCYDADEAGQKAAARAGLILLKEGLNVKIIILPGKHDPDSFVNEEGKDAFEQLVEKSDDFTHFFARFHADKLKSPREKSELIRELGIEFRDIRDPVIRNSIIRQISLALGIDENIIIQRVRQEYRRKMGKGKTVTSPPHEEIAPQSAVEKAETDLLKLLLSGDQELGRFIKSYFNPETIKNSPFSTILKKVISMENISEIHHLLESETTEDEKRILTKMLMDFEPFEEPYKLAADCLCALEKHKLDREIDLLRNSLKENEKNDSKSISILKEIQSKQIERKKITQKYQVLLKEWSQ